MTENKPTPSPLRSAQSVYDVWTMDAKGNSRRVAQVPTLPKVLPELTPERRKEYVYVFKWTPQVPEGQYLWGCLCNHVHTNDLRSQVRACLRS